MFHLAKSIYDQCTLWPEYSVLILGLDNAGKTTLLEELKSIYIANYKKIPAARILPTVGQNVATLTIDHLHLKFWDVGGQDSLRELWQDYYEQAHAIVFVIDSCDTERLIECKNTLLKIITDDKVEGLPVLMLANKQDIQIDSKLEIAQIKDIFNKIAENLNANDSKVLPISAYTGDGVQDAITWLKNRVILNKHNRPPIYKK
jgi:ADP-ribosylation factor related protein 1